MTKKFRVILSFICLALFCGCGSLSAEEAGEGNQAEEQGLSQESRTLRVSVTDLSGNMMTVCPEEGAWERNSSDAFFLSSKWLEDDIQPMVGMELNVVYDGRVLETYPAQFGKIESVTVLTVPEQLSLSPDADGGEKALPGTDGEEEKTLSGTSNGAEAPSLGTSDGSKAPSSGASNIPVESSAVDGGEREGWRRVEFSPQEGSRASISFALPENWKYEACTSEDIPVSDITIAIYPSGREEGTISICFAYGLGLCGTGLVSEEITFNGHEAWLGTYDNHAYWDFINLSGEYRYCIIWNNAGESWYEEYADVVDEILSTVEFNVSSL